MNVSFISPALWYQCLILIALLLLPLSAVQAQEQVQEQAREQPRPWGSWLTWGDQGDGTYHNPVLPGDYSDLDCIRIGSDYYVISSTMQFSPGMVILHSKDLVNWSILGHVVSDLTQIGPELNWDRMNRSGKGVWAGAMRYHDNKFRVYFGTADEGYFMTSAANPAGPWAPLTSFMKESGWDDCCPFWDDDGQGYFIGTRFKDNYKTYIFKMTPDGRAPIKESAVLVNEGAHREANKLFKKDGLYYHFFSEVKGARVVMMQRSSKVLGPYTEKKQLTDQNREAKEPNQGGIVDTENGDWYFFTHHGTGDWEGRAASLLPVTWVDGWPLIGETGPHGLGRMAWSGKKPVQNMPIVTPQTSDEFNTSTLPVQWEWNYQPRPDKWSLAQRPGWLRLHAFKPLQADHLLKAGNTLTQRSMRTNSNEVVIKLDLSGMAHGQKAGLCHFAAMHHSVLGVAQEGTTRTLEYKKDGEITRGDVLSGNSLWLRSIWGLDGKSQYSYSLDGTTFTDFGEPYQLMWGAYRGDRIGIYTYNNKSESGYVDVDFFHYTYHGPHSPNR
ncbi:MAG TPA: glycoside hydrolase 43 family protein [Abditibacteriaceae bacterium]|jgi:beta-xylosidase